MKVPEDAPLIGAVNPPPPIVGVAFTCTVIDTEDVAPTESTTVTDSMYVPADTEEIT